MRPEAVFQWVSTLAACSVDELSTLTDTLLVELEKRDLQIVDPAVLEITFSPLVNASREKLDEELEKHRALVADRYGQQAFEPVASTDAPIVLDALLAQEVEALSRALVASNARGKAAAKAVLAGKERIELERYRAKSKEKGQKNKNRRGRKSKKKTTKPRR